MISTTFVKQYLGWSSILLIACLSGIASAADGNAIPVELGKVRVQDEQALLWTPATVYSRQSATLSPEISGRLEWLVEVGEYVHAGESVVRISDTALQIQLRSDEAEIRRLQASEEFSRRQLKRFRTLSESNSMAASELDRLTMELRMLEQERAVREARRDATVYNIALAAIAAPFSGVIVERNSETGEYVRAGDPVLRIVNMAALEIRARAPVSIARYVHPGKTVLLETDEIRIETVVTAMVPSGDERERMIEVRAEIPAGDWIVGDAVRIALPSSGSMQRLAISRDALVLRGSEVYVFKVLEDSTARRIPVRPGRGRDNIISIEGDLQADDDVVIRGAETLQDGQRVRVPEAKSLADTTAQMFDKG